MITRYYLVCLITGARVEITPEQVAFFEMLAGPNPSRAWLTIVAEAEESQVSA